MASKRAEKMEIPDEATPSTSSSSSKDESPKDSTKYEVNSRPICLIVLGMAGSGKTSFVKRLTQLGNLQDLKPYVINLDPAVQEVPYHANIGKYQLRYECNSLQMIFIDIFSAICRYSRYR